MYIDVITLAEAKNFLRIDDTLTEDDAQITRMIGSALLYVEMHTNHLVYARSKSYNMIDGELRVYDFPINTITSPTEADMNNEQKTLYKIFGYGNSTSVLVLNVGYTAPANVPPGLIDVAFEILDLMYYGSKDGESLEKKLSEMSKQTLQQHKRFLI